MAEQQRGWPRAGLAQHIPQRGLAQEARSIEYGKHHQRPATAHYSERRCEHSALRSRLRTSKDHGLSRCLVLRCPCWPAVAFGARDRGPGERQTRVRVLCAVDKWDPATRTLCILDMYRRLAFVSPMGLTLACALLHIRVIIACMCKITPEGLF